MGRTIKGILFYKDVSSTIYDILYCFRSKLLMCSSFRAATLSVKTFDLEIKQNGRNHCRYLFLADTEEHPNFQNGMSFWSKCNAQM